MRALAVQPSGQIADSGASLSAVEIVRPGPPMPTTAWSRVVMARSGRAGVEWLWAVPHRSLRVAIWPSNRSSPMWSFGRNGPGDHSCGRVWVVSTANRWHRPVSVAPKAGNAYADEMRLRHEASRTGTVSMGPCGTVAHHLKPSPCSARCCGGQPPIDGAPSDVEDFFRPVSVNALRHPRCRIGISDLWSARRRAGEAGFGGAVGDVA